MVNHGDSTSTIISTTSVPEMSRMEWTERGLVIGPAVTVSALIGELEKGGSQFNGKLCIILVCAISEIYWKYY